MKDKPQQVSLFDSASELPPGPPQSTQSDDRPVVRVSVPQEPPPDFSALESFIGAWGKQ